MMVPHRTNNGDDEDEEREQRIRQLQQTSILTWPMLVWIFSVAAAVAGSAIWLGSLSQQISVNTHRLEAIEHHDEQTREIESQIKARLAVIENEIHKKLGNNPLP